MRDWRVHRITQEVRKLDRELFCVRASNGMLQIHRNAPRIEVADAEEEFKARSPQSQFILAITDDWTLRGKIVEWGLQPIIARLQEMDSWSHTDMYEKMVKNRESFEKNQEREKKNNLRAIAADLRKDFAKATNDVVIQK